MTQTHNLGFVGCAYPWADVFAVVVMSSFMLSYCLAWLRLGIYWFFLLISFCWMFTFTRLSIFLRCEMGNSLSWYCMDWFPFSQSLIVGFLYLVGVEYVFTTSSYLCILFVFFSNVFRLSPLNSQENYIIISCKAFWWHR